ncbi:hypothetical protein [Falsiphaeobacter marinintestinus]|uniref:hypothetical protein n=1 Tax=Falsiphaeobacter marinintestinus TaxID=1492905 RepID=UPI0011B3BF64|nr:hypothetical protein [Phaeobacter marinintestinus]
MRQVSITEHFNAPKSVYIDGAFHRADTDSQIGAILRDAGVSPDQTVHTMDARGKTDTLKAGQFLAAAPPVKKRKGKV